jgi:hypothetical protein
VHTLQNIDELFITLDIVLGNEQPDGTVAVDTGCI